MQLLYCLLDVVSPKGLCLYLDWRSFQDRPQTCVDQPFGCRVCIGSGECLKLLLEAWSISLPHFPAIFWATGGLILCPKQPWIMMTVAHSDKTARSSSFLLASWSADLFSLSAMDGLPSPSSHIGWVIWLPLCRPYCEVIWEETAFSAPSENN